MRRWSGVRPLVEAAKLRTEDSEAVTKNRPKTHHNNATSSTNQIEHLLLCPLRKHKEQRNIKRYMSG